MEQRPPADISSMSISDLVIQTKKAYGLSWQGLADQFGRSEKMMRKLASGQSSGESYRTALTQLYTSGQVQTGVPRRRDKSGKMVKVRSKAGTGSKSATPAFDTRGAPAPKVGRNVYARKHVILPGNNRAATVTMPKSSRSSNRARAWNDVKTDLTSLSRAQAKTDKRLSPRVLVESSNGKDRRLSLIHI